LSKQIEDFKVKSAHCTSKENLFNENKNWTNNFKCSKENFGSLSSDF